ncbi:hypothetical protein A6R70_21585 [Agrobacterium rubi]|nr:hypothetical protein [Agrobacterium rubi]
MGSGLFRGYEGCYEAIRPRAQPDTRLVDMQTSMNNGFTGAWMMRWRSRSGYFRPRGHDEADN